MSYLLRIVSFLGSCGGTGAANDPGTSLSGEPTMSFPQADVAGSACEGAAWLEALNSLPESNRLGSEAGSDPAPGGSTSGRVTTRDHAAEHRSNTPRSVAGDSDVRSQPSQHDSPFAEVHDRCGLPAGQAAHWVARSGGEYASVLQVGAVRRDPVLFPPTHHYSAPVVPARPPQSGGVDAESGTKVNADIVPTASVQLLSCAVSVQLETLPVATTTASQPAAPALSEHFPVTYDRAVAAYSNPSTTSDCLPRAVSLAAEPPPPAQLSSGAAASAVHVAEGAGPPDLAAASTATSTVPPRAGVDITKASIRSEAESVSAAVSGRSGATHGRLADASAASESPAMLSAPERSSLLPRSVQSPLTGLDAQDDVLRAPQAVLTISWAPTPRADIATGDDSRDRVAADSRNPQPAVVSSAESAVRPLLVVAPVSHRDRVPLDLDQGLAVSSAPTAKDGGGIQVARRVPKDAGSKSAASPARSDSVRLPLPHSPVTASVSAPLAVPLAPQWHSDIHDDVAQNAPSDTDRGIANPIVALAPSTADQSGVRPSRSVAAHLGESSFKGSTSARAPQVAASFEPWMSEPMEGVRPREKLPSLPPPSVHIGSVEIVVEASRTQAAEPAVATSRRRDFASRHYLRNW